MPLVRIAVPRSTPVDVKQKLSNAVHTSLVSAFNVPEADKFHLFDEHGRDDMVVTPEYLGIKYSAKFVVIQITANEGRTLEMKKALFHNIASKIAETTDIPASDVFINLVEVKKENWSFGNGIAQYAQ
jgi:phenylpyruvate tautomerase PptA (4-oxalocrotonate tautomerase family)